MRVADPRASSTQNPDLHTKTQLQIKPGFSSGSPFVTGSETYNEIFSEGRRSVPAVNFNHTACGGHSAPGKVAFFAILMRF